MNAMLIVAIAIVVLLFLLAARMPVAFALLTAGVSGLLMLDSFQVANFTLSALPYQSVSIWTLVVIPMFILMGMLAVHGALAEHLFSAAQRVLRRVPGGLGLAVVTTSAGFAAVTGSSVAAVAAVGKVSLGEMEKAGYDRKFAGGIVGATGTLGILIPPSVALVLYGVISGESVGKLLIAGIIPGLITALAYMAAVLIRARLNPSLVGMAPGAGLRREPVMVPVAAGRPTVPAAKVAAQSSRAAVDHPAPPHTVPSSDSGLLDTVPILVLFAVVIGGVYLGWFTPTEAGAVGAFVALVFMAVHAWRNKLSFPAKLVDSLREAASMTSMVFALILGASVFSYFLVLAGAPAALTEWMTGLSVPGWLVVLLLLLTLVPLGMFLEGMSMLLIAVPLAYPVIIDLGYDGIWFGVLVIKLIEVGLLTPPVGLNVFVLKGVAPDLSMSDAFRAIMAFLPVEIVVIALLFVFPSIVTWLPNLMK